MEELGAGRREERQNQRERAKNETHGQRALVHDVRNLRRHPLRAVCARRGHFDSSPDVVVCGNGTGKVAPEPGSLNLGAAEGTACPAASAAVAFWLNCSALMYATMLQRSSGGICEA